MKIYVICCVPAQIPYLGKILFLRYGPKCSQPIRLQDLFQPTLFPEQINEITFFHADTNSQKSETEQNILGWVWSQMVVTSLVTEF